MADNRLARSSMGLSADMLLDDLLRRPSSPSSYPWSTADEFFVSDRYAGAKLFPGQRLMLKLWNLELDDLSDWEKGTLERWQKGFNDPSSPIGVPPDIECRVAYLKSLGYDHFPVIVPILGRRASKSFLCGRQLSLADAQLLWRGLPDVSDALADRAREGAFLEERRDDEALARKDPTAYSIVMANTGTQAQETTFTDHYNAVISNRWLQKYIMRATPFEMRFQTVQDRIRTLELLEQGVPLERELSSVVARPVPSSAGSNRGRAVFSYCVAPDTLIRMADGSDRPMSSLAVGDMLTGFDGALRPLGSRVTHIHTHVRREALRLVFDLGPDLVCSTDHRLMASASHTADPSYIHARDLRPGMSVRALHGSARIRRVEPLGELDLMDITTGTHNYIANGLLSHNCYDEAAFSIGGSSQRSADVIIRAMRPSLNQFGPRRTMLFPTSPWAREGVVYRMYAQGHVLMDEWLAMHGMADTGANRAKASQDVDRAGEALTADPTVFVAQLESWRLYEGCSEDAFVPTYVPGFTPKRLTVEDEHGCVYELDAVTNAEPGDYVRTDALPAPVIPPEPTGGAQDAPEPEEPVSGAKTDENAPERP